MPQNGIINLLPTICLPNTVKPLFTRSVKLVNLRTDTFYLIDITKLNRFCELCKKNLIFIFLTINY